jgi:hypothetical protein
VHPARQLKVKTEQGLAQGSSVSRYYFDVLNGKPLVRDDEGA